MALAAAYLLLEAGTGSDVYEVGRRHGRLSLAAEMQWQLLPARAYRTPHFYVAGHLEPALRVAGDAFDFAIDSTSLTLAVVDASGDGGDAALLSTLAVTALRNARRSQLPLHDQAALASDMIWQHTHGQQHASVLLLQVNAERGTARAIDAGSGALIRSRNRAVQRQILDRQLPLGMFDDTMYHSQPIDLAPGDRAFLLTDGATGNRGEDDFQRALELLARAEDKAARHPPPEVVRGLVAGLLDDQEPEDDVTVVSLDWTGEGQGVVG